MVARAEPTPRTHAGHRRRDPASAADGHRDPRPDRDERAALAALDPAARDAEVLFRFAAKEAIYKALDPWVQRLVSFQEAGS